MTTADRLDRLSIQASASREHARNLMNAGRQDDALVPCALVAIVDQLALANALKILEMARDAGEPDA